MKHHPLLDFFWKAAVFLASGYVFVQAFLELEHIGWGSGSWFWRLSLKWAIVLVLFLLLLLINLAVIGMALWIPTGLSIVSSILTAMRERLVWLRWLLVGMVLIFPLWFLAGTYWGLLLTSPAIRFLILFWMAGVMAFLLSHGRNAFSWRQFIVALILTGAGAGIARELANVTSYLFSLYWSEGNRFWDYSIMFGRDRYLFPADQPIYAYIEKPRQFLWGLPFLLPGLSIGGMRLWNAIVYIFPYMLLGWAAFRYASRGWGLILCSLWAYLFLSQGPIYTQLIFVALLVALTWYRRWWIALPAFLLATFLAYFSRITWSVAPVLWMLMLLVGSFSIPWKQLLWKGPIRWAIILVALVATSLLALNITSLYGKLFDLLTRQPLLWYRLLPNSTYPAGILLGLILAVGPALFLCAYLIVIKKWSMDRVQRSVVFGFIAIAFAVGIVVSAKIGGGADLHNMDVFLLSTLFLAVLAWKNGGAGVVLGPELKPAAVKIGFILLTLIPAFQQMQAIQPLVSESEQLARSTLVFLGKDESRMLPSRVETGQILTEIQQQVARAQETGEVLFMDQRQLLTFGYIPNVPLVVEYEKKLLMDLALSKDQVYFANFYEDISSRRFSLIVSEPLRTRQELSERVTESFLEEDDIWTTWVAEPTLCYYTPIYTNEDARVQLLVPRPAPLDCTLP